MGLPMNTSVIDRELSPKAEKKLSGGMTDDDLLEIEIRTTDRTGYCFIDPTVAAWAGSRLIGNIWGCTGLPCPAAGSATWPTCLGLKTP
jgi:hypothetical protein